MSCLSDSMPPFRVYNAALAENSFTAVEVPRTVAPSTRSTDSAQYAAIFLKQVEANKLVKRGTVYCGGGEVGHARSIGEGHSHSRWRQGSEAIWDR